MSLGLAIYLGIALLSVPYMSRAFLYDWGEYLPIKPGSVIVCFCMGVWGSAMWPIGVPLFWLIIRPPGRITSALSRIKVALGMGDEREFDARVRKCVRIPDRKY